MRRILALLLAAFCAPAQAQSVGNANNFVVGAVASGSYTGPGDVVTSGWYSYPCLTRAYSHSTVGNSCVVIERASDSTQCTLVTNNGTGTSQSPFGGLAVDVGTPCNSNTQTAAQFCNGTQCYIVTSDDQSGNGHNYLGSGVAARGAQLTFNCIGSLPCWSGTASSTFASTPFITPASSVSAISQPWSIFAVWFYSAGGSTSVILSDNCNTGGPGCGAGLSGNTSAGLSANASACSFSAGSWSGGTWYSSSLVTAASSTSIITFLGFQTTGLNCGSFTMPATGNNFPGWRGYVGTGTPTAKIAEAGLLSAALTSGSSGTACGLYNNEKTYYGLTAGGSSC